MIRLAGPKDDPRLIEQLQVECGLIPTPFHTINDGSLRVWMHGKDGVLVSAFPVFRECRVLSLAVKDGARRRGVARELVEAAVGDAKELGASIITMECRRANRAVQAIAEGIGGKRLGIRAGYYPDGEDAIVYGLELATPDAKLASICSE